MKGMGVRETSRSSLSSLSGWPCCLVPAFALRFPALRWGLASQVATCRLAMAASFFCLISYPIILALANVHKLWRQRCTSWTEAASRVLVGRGARKTDTARADMHI